MTKNHMFPLRIRSDMKVKTTQVVHETNNVHSRFSFKEENTKSTTTIYTSGIVQPISEEVILSSGIISEKNSKVRKLSSEEEKYSGAKIQITFQLVVKDEP